MSDPTPPSRTSTLAQPRANTARGPDAPTPLRAARPDSGIPSARPSTQGRVLKRPVLGRTVLGRTVLRRAVFGRATIESPDLKPPVSRNADIQSADIESAEIDTTPASFVADRARFTRSQRDR